MTGNNFVPNSPFIQMMIHDDTSLWLRRCCICQVGGKYAILEMTDTGDGWTYHGIFDSLQGVLDFIVKLEGDGEG